MIHFLVHGEKDTVGVATVDIKAGETLSGWNMQKDEPVSVPATTEIPLGHKVALSDIPAGGTVIKYDHAIGKATQAIKQGDHVHTHNLKSARW